MSKTLKQVLIAIGAIVAVFAVIFVGIIVYKVIRQKKENVNIAYSITEVQISSLPVQVSTTTVGTGYLSSSSTFLYEGTVSGTIQIDYEGDWYTVTDMELDGVKVATFTVKGSGKEPKSFSVNYSGSSNKLYSSTDYKIGKTSIYKSDQILN